MTMVSRIACSFVFDFSLVIPAIDPREGALLSGGICNMLGAR